jgi:phosphoglycerate kinase
MIMDFGAKTSEEVCHIISNAHTVFWNGPLGVIEFPEFERGTTMLAECIASNSHITSIVGGGDTASFIDRIGLRNKFTHISTGGGASLELMAGKKLPGIEALLDK